MNTKTCVLFALASAALSGCQLSIVSPEPAAAVVVEQPGVEVVAEADVPVIEVDEYFFVGGHYYYWHPGVGRYVMLRGEPPYGHRVLHVDHLAPRGREEHPGAASRPAQQRAISRPAQQPATYHPAQKPSNSHEERQPEKKEKKDDH